MRKRVVTVSAVLFAVAFVLNYLMLCYLPALRIRLAAEPLEFFLASVTHNWVNKTILSAIAGGIVCLIPIVLAKRRGL